MKERQRAMETAHIEKKHLLLLSVAAKKKDNKCHCVHVFFEIASVLAYYCHLKFVCHITTEVCTCVHVYYRVSSCHLRLLHTIYEKKKNGCSKEQTQKQHNGAKTVGDCK